MQDLWEAGELKQLEQYVLSNWKLDIKMGLPASVNSIKIDWNKRSWSSDEEKARWKNKFKRTDWTAKLDEELKRRRALFIEDTHMAFDDYLRKMRKRPVANSISTDVNLFEVLEMRKRAKKMMGNEMKDLELDNTLTALN